MQKTVGRHRPNDGKCKAAGKNLNIHNKKCDWLAVCFHWNWLDDCESVLSASLFTST